MHCPIFTVDLKNVKMYKKILFLLVLVCLITGTVSAQAPAGIFAYPDISAEQIVFSYADDLWLVSRKGGTAMRLSTPVGPEFFPRFSPDGQTVVYTANYNGNYSLYTLPVTGGVPTRLTWSSWADMAQDWTPDGKQILFASDRESGSNRFSQFYTISRDGGMPRKLAVPFGEFASLSPDGTKLAFTTKSRIFRTWKRYRGGMAADIYLYDLATDQSENITLNDANDELPMWHGQTIYFLSDRGASSRANLWAYDLASRQTRQITSFTEVDVRYPGLGGDAIVFLAGDQMYVYDLKTGIQEEVSINLVTDMAPRMPHPASVSSFMQHFEIAPDGKRAIVEARGEIFSVPAEHGPVVNLTRAPGSAERYPAWSPDGRKAVWWTDRSGEYELALYDFTTGEEEILTHLGAGYRYQPYWSPDGQWITYIDQTMAIHLLNVKSRMDQVIDRQRYAMHGGLEGFTVSWSPDSRWLAYARDQVNQGQVIILYDTREGVAHAATSGYYTDANPSFSRDGKYLYLTTNRSFDPVYSDFDNSWTYPNSTRLAVLTLQEDTPSLWAVRNDTVALAALPDTDKKKGKKDKKDNEEADALDGIPAVTIDLEGIERRMEIFPVPAGNFRGIAAAKENLIFLQGPNSGSDGQSATLKLYDRQEREVKTIVEGIDGFLLTANGEKVLVWKEGQLYLIDPAPDQKLEKSFRTSEMRMTVDPPAEWRQVFNDVWRLERDFFYDKDMHGVDWQAMHARYGKWLDVCATRSDLNMVIGELIGELNASHAYRGGGDMPEPSQTPVGYLGIDWAVSGAYYAVGRILRGAPWDAEVRSPLDQPGLTIREGDLILAVNGQPLTRDQEPSAAFIGLADADVELTMASAADPQKTRKVLVHTMSSEARLRNLDWIEANRQYVEKASGGRVGYIYVPNTGVDGQNELMRQFSGQWHKDALLIDERWNSGGQIPDRFIELLNRKPLAYWAVRDGETWRWPPVGHFGPKAMLINGWSGSGGDAFPDYFRKSGLGPLVGTRTWGGLIGISGAPQLIDNGGVTVPTFRMYNPDGTWFKEGHGVDPDILVPEDPGAIARGQDPQIDRAVGYLMEQLKNYQPPVPPRPASEKR